MARNTKALVDRFADLLEQCQLHPSTATDLRLTMSRMRLTTGPGWSRQVIWLWFLCRHAWKLEKILTEIKKTNFQCCAARTLGPVVREAATRAQPGVLQSFPLPQDPGTLPAPHPRMQRPPPATFVENYETDEPVLELARFMEGGGEDDLGGPLYEECATLLQTDPMALFQKFAQFVEGKMSMGDDDLEGSFHCLFLLLRHLSDEQVQGAIDSLLLLLVKEESRPVTRLKVMANMYALVDFMPSARYPVFLAMVKYARETGHTKVLSAHFQHLETWVAEWSCNADQTVALYWEAVQGLLKMGAEAEATALLHDMLKAADAGDASTIASVGEQAKLACVSSHIYCCCPGHHVWTSSWCSNEGAKK
jgi:hypothetical protein